MAEGKKDAPVVGIDAETEAEQAVLGSLLLDPYAHQRVKDSLIVDDFKVPAHRGIWEAMGRLAESGAAIDTVTLSNEMGADALEVCGGVAYLVTLAARVPTTLNVEYYAHAVRKNSVERGLDRAAGLLVLGGGGGELSARIAKAEELLGRARARITGAMKGGASLRVLPSMNDVVRTEVDWLWHPWLAKGKFALLEGDPDLGKSVLSLVIAATITRGWPLPGQDREARREPGRVLILADEDGYGDTVRPRLEALGADLALIRPVLGLTRQREDIELTLDMEGVAALSDHVESYRPTLIIVDPLFSYLGGKVDINKGNEVRAVLRPLVGLCERLGTTMLALRHFTKMNGASAIHRGQGNIDFTAAARSILAVRDDPDNAGRKILCHTKSNLAEKGKALAYRIGTGARGIEFLWEGEVETSVTDLFAPSDDDGYAIADAKAFLADALFEGPKPGKEIQHEAREAGISERSLWRAKSRTGVRARKEGDRWFWELPLKDLAEMADLAEFRNGANTSQNGKSATLPSLPLSDDGEQELY